MYNSRSIKCKKKRNESRNTGEGGDDRVVSSRENRLGGRVNSAGHRGWKNGTQGGCRNTRISELNARFGLSRERERAEDKILPEGPATIFPGDSPIATSIRTIEFRSGRNLAKPNKRPFALRILRVLQSKIRRKALKRKVPYFFIYFETNDFKQNVLLISSSN